MWADRDPELRRHQDDGKILVDTSHPAAVDLADIDSAGLHQLLEHHCVVTVFAGRNPNGCLTTDPSVTQNVVRIRRFFHPPWLQLSQLIRTSNCLFNSPLLIGIDHHEVVSTNLFTNDAATAQIILRISTDLELEVGP